MFKLIVSILLLSILIGVTGCQTTETGSPGHGTAHGKGKPVDIIFSDYERQLIYEYYSAQRKHMPPGLAKKQKVPPGHLKQLQRKGTLPPGLRTSSLPYDLVRKLPRLPANITRARVGNDVVLIDETTRVIYDVITDIMGPQ